MSPLLFVALVAVYLLCIAALVAVGSIAGENGGDPRSLEERLAFVRARTDPAARAARSVAADTRRTRGRVLESTTGVAPARSHDFRRMRSDVAAAPGRVRTARPD